MINLFRKAYLFSVYAFFLITIPVTGKSANKTYVVKSRIQVAALIGSPLKQLCFLYQTTDLKSWRSFVHQIDERNLRGDYVLNEGMPYTARQGNEILDSSEEIVLGWSEKLSVLSEKDVTDFIKENFPHSQHTVFDLAGMGSALALNVSANDQSRFDEYCRPLQPQRVKFDQSKSEILTSRYHYKFNKEQPTLLGDIFLVSSKGGSTHGLSQMKGSGFLMPLRIWRHTPFFVLSDRSLKSELESWSCGPLRCIVAVGVKFSGLLSWLNLHLFSEIVFYENGLSIPTKIEFPFSPKNRLAEGSGLVYLLNYADIKDQDLEHTFLDISKHDASVNLKEKQTLANYQIKTAIEGTSVNLIVSIRIDPRILTFDPPVSLPVFINRDALMKDKKKWQGWRNRWTWLDKMDHDFAVFIDISDIPKGEYDFSLNVTIEDG